MKSEYKFNQLKENNLFNQIKSLKRAKLKNKKNFNNINTLYNINKNINDISVIIFIIILNLMIKSNLIYNTQLLSYSEFSNITLKINKAGTLKIYSQHAAIKPELIYINGVNKTINYEHTFVRGNNVIKLIYKTDNIKSTRLLFYECSAINEIDLSCFDTSNVIDMGKMFYMCTSLSSINLSNINTSNVKIMEGMFYLCESLTSLNLSNFNTSRVINMKYMFVGCHYLISLNLSSFDTSMVNNMESMFSGCLNFTSLYLSNFNTSRVINMKYMFGSCLSLISLNLSSFDTSQVTDMSYMFRDCRNLISLNLSSFDTSQVTDISCMFYICISLISLDLSNFNTSKVSNMGSFFYHCYSLISLNLSSFDTSQVTDMSRMFCYCEKLISLDLSNFNTSKVSNMCSMFAECNSLTSLNLSSFDTSQVIDMCYMFSNCYKFISLDLSNFNTSKVSNMSHMFEYCSSLGYINLGNIKINKNVKNESIITNLNFRAIICYNYSNWKDILNGYDKYISIICENKEIQDNDIKCYKKNINNKYYSGYICTQCGNNYALKINDNNNNGTHVYCYQVSDGYYINNDNMFIMPCYTTCLTCDKGGNDLEHNCIKCNDNYTFFKKIRNYMNCYNESFNDINIDTTELLMNNNIELTYKVNKSNTEIIDNENNKELTNELKKSIKELISNTDLIMNNDNISLNNETDKIILENNSFILTDIIFYLINNFEKTENNNYMKITKGNILISISNVKKQQEIIIDLNECENKLKIFYNISYNDSLYILIIEKREDGMKIPKVEYGVYHSLYNKNLTQLNLTICQGMKIDITIPVKLNETLEKHNSSSDYYNDICSKTTSEYGTDISLSDRKNEFINKNLTLCEEDCNLIDYNYTTEKAKCSCLVKIKIPLFEEIKFDKKKLFKSFIDINNFANIQFLKCYKKVFKGKSLIKNYGFFIFLFLYIYYFISLFLFYFKFYAILINKIKIIIDAKMNKFKFRKKKENRITTNNPLNIDNENKIDLNIEIDNNKIEGDIDMFPPKKKSGRNREILKEVKEEIINKPQIENKNIEEKIINEENDTNLIYKEILKHTDEELNDLDYEKALKFDKRSFSQYYLSLLKSGNLLIFSFYTHNKDYNSQIIKIFLFFFSFGIQLTINAIFFSDATMHKIYIDEGSFNFIYQLPQIIYSSLISFIIDTIIKYLSLSEKKILEIKRIKKRKNLSKKFEKIIKTLKIRLALFFIVALIFLTGFGYYVTCFCGIYQNTQIHLINDTAISFGLSVVYPFGISLIPGFIRMKALKTENKDKEYLYKLSQFVQNF